MIRYFSILNMTNITQEKKKQITYLLNMVNGCGALSTRFYIPHRYLQLVSVTVIDRREQVCPSHPKSTARFAPLTPGHGFLSHCLDSYAQSLDDTPNALLLCHSEAEFMEFWGQKHVLGRCSVRDPGVHDICKDLNDGYKKFFETEIYGHLTIMPRCASSSKCWHKFRSTRLYRTSLYDDDDAPVHKASSMVC